MSSDNIVIDLMTTKDEECLQSLIKRNLAGYTEAGSVIASSLRRLDQFRDIYKSEGSCFLVARDPARDGLCIGGAGIGPLHGLPHSEGLGEVRDLVVDPEYRGQGIGSRLIKRCLEEARTLQYQRLYLETTPQMEHAQKLFLRSGFRPVTHEMQHLSKAETLPCYYILNFAEEGLTNAKRA